MGVRTKKLHKIKVRKPKKIFKIKEGDMYLVFPVIVIVHNVPACTFSLNAKSKNQIFQTNPYTLNMNIGYYNCFENTFSVHI